MLDVEKHWRETTTGEGMTGPPVKVRGRKRRSRKRLENIGRFAYSAKGPSLRLHFNTRE